MRCGERPRGRGAAGAAAVSFPGECRAAGFWKRREASALLSPRNAATLPIEGAPWGRCLLTPARIIALFIRQQRGRVSEGLWTLALGGRAVGGWSGDDNRLVFIVFILFSVPRWWRQKPSFRVTVPWVPKLKHQFYLPQVSRKRERGHKRCKQHRFVPLSTPSTAAC